MFQTHVTGLSHHNYLFASARLKPGTVVTLERDPHNKHDAKAVRVLFDGNQIGWVPKHRETSPSPYQAAIAALLDAGVFLVAKVVLHDHTSEDLQRRLFIEVVVEDAHKSCFACKNVNPNHFDVDRIKNTALEMYIKTQVEAARKEGIEAGKSFQAIFGLGPAVEIQGFLLPQELHDVIFNKGHKAGYTKACTKYALLHKQELAANEILAKGRVAQGQEEGLALGRREAATTIKAILDGNINLYDGLVAITGLTRAEVKRRWLKMAYDRSGSPRSNNHEEMIVRMVQPKYFKTVSTLTLELRSTDSNNMNPVIPDLKVKPGDKISVTIIERG